MPIDVFKDMNEEQREAIAHVDGPLLVVAGAGSGKTRVITHRIANIIQHGTRPDRILAITFTNKAAGEMQERVERLTHLKTPWITTFHSAGLRLLKMESAHLGFEHPFSVIDPDDQKRLFKRIYEELHLDAKAYDPRGVIHRISAWKNAFDARESVRASSEEEVVALKAWERYEAIAQKECLLDFDDLLVWPVRLLDRDAELRRKWQARFPYVLIDEYQDTNTVQYRLIRLLAAHGNVCATGDPDQAIYGWRGADIENILRFEKDFPGCKTILLERNYRSTKMILKAAQGVVERNTRRKEKTIRTDRADGVPLTLAVVDDEVDEALAVAAKIDSFRRAGRKLNEIAIFYRANAMSRAIEDGLRRRGIPYRMVGGTRFFDRKEVRDLLAYAKLIANPRDSLSFERIANVPKRGVGDRTLAALMDLATDELVGFHEILMTDALLERIAVGRNANPLNGLAKIWRTLQALPKANPVAAIEGILRHTGLEEFYVEGEDGEAGHERVGNMREVLTAAQQFIEGMPNASLDDFLGHVALITSADEISEAGAEQVTLMTLHGAKGLEFPVVFIVGLEQGIMPIERAGSTADLEEERRLMYVGITRTMEILFLSRARCRMQYGKTMRNPPSLFLAEIPQECLSVKGADYADAVLEGAGAGSGPGDGGPRFAGYSGPRKRPNVADLGLITGADLKRQLATDTYHAEAEKTFKAQTALDTRDGDPFAVAARVHHTIFGGGEVVGYAGPVNDRRILVRFDETGQRELLLSFCVGKLHAET